MLQFAVGSSLEQSLDFSFGAYVEVSASHHSTHPGQYWFAIKALESKRRNDRTSILVGLEDWHQFKPSLVVHVVHEDDFEDFYGFHGFDGQLNAPSLGLRWESKDIPQELLSSRETEEPFLSLLFSLFLSRTFSWYRLSYSLRFFLFFSFRFLTALSFIQRGTLSISTTTSSLHSFIFSRIFRLSRLFFSFLLAFHLFSVSVRSLCFSLSIF